MSDFKQEPIIVPPGGGHDMAFNGGSFIHKVNSKDIAKDRLKVVLVHDRIDLAPGRLEELKEDLIDVISAYLEIDYDKIDVALTDINRQSSLTAQVPIIGVAYQQF